LFVDPNTHLEQLVAANQQRLSLIAVKLATRPAGFSR
jgi:hypothetical protein